MHRLGLTGVNLIEHADLIERVNSPLYKKARRGEPNTGILNPAKLSREWRRVLDGAGVPIYENTPVLTMDMAAGRQRLRDPARDRHSEQGRACDECLDARISAAGDQAGSGLDLHRADRTADRRAIGQHRLARARGVEDFRDLVTTTG